MCFVDYAAIPPPVNVEPFETNTAVYDFSDTRSSYDVEDGNEFSVICTSSGTFSGRVVWINNSKSLHYDGLGLPVIPV